MSRVVLLCFVHGFKGNENTFRTFPNDLQSQLANVLPDHRVETAVYPQYETKGELAQASQAFLEWLKQRVMDLRKVHCETPWPPNDNDVGVIIIAHSMGGFVAADALFLALDERRERIAADDTATATDNATDNAALTPMFPPIQGLLAFDTPYNGLSRSMFVYGAFSNYSKIQTVFNVMTALSAGPMALGKLAMTAAGPAASAGDNTASASSAAAAAASKSSTRSASSRALGWRAWQLVAVRTGTVGAIAAGGVAAYTHRKAIVAGVKKVRGLDRQTLREGYRSGVDAIGQGLAYVNRRSVGASFAWLSAHVTFVGALVKQAELHRRLQRLAALQGVGVHDVYISLGANGYWSGGYFVPERTFCAVPEMPETSETSAESGSGDAQTNEKNEKNEKAAALFERWTMRGCDDEVQAHVSLFRRDANLAYDEMTQRAAELAVGWLANTDTPIIDDVQTFAAMAADAQANTNESSIHATEDGVEIDGDEAGAVGQGPDADKDKDKDNDTDKTEPDESPIDIAATASLLAQTPGSSAGTAIVVDDDDDDDDAAVADIMSSTDTEHVPAEDKANYLRHLLSVAQNAGTGLKRVGDWSAQWSAQLPSKMARIDGLSRTMFTRAKGSSTSSVAEAEVASKETVTEETAEAASATHTEETPGPRADTGFIN